MSHARQVLRAKYYGKKKREVAVVLKKLVEDEGYRFLDLSAVDPSTVPTLQFLANQKDVIAFFGSEQFNAVFPTCDPRLQDFECGLLLNVADLRRKRALQPLRIPKRDEVTKQRVVNWLKGASAWECIVCFEDKDTCEKARTAKNARFTCHCGAIMCFGCSLDMLLANSADFMYDCPNCREVTKPIAHLQMIYDVLVETPSLEGMSEAQLSLIKRYADYDGSAKALKGVRRKQRDLHKRVTAQLLKIHSSPRRRPKTESDLDLNTASANAFAEIINEIEAKKKRKEEESDRKSAAAPSAHLVSRNACANCGKAFWDKKERQRAPKCQKCSRAFYCNSKCRKAHKKKHSLLCAAKGMKRKRVPKKKPKQAKAKAGCAPY